MYSLLCVRLVRISYTLRKGVGVPFWRRLQHDPCLDVVYNPEGHEKNAAPVQHNTLIAAYSLTPATSNGMGWGDPDCVGRYSHKLLFLKYQSGYITDRLDNGLSLIYSQRVVLLELLEDFDKEC